MRGVFQASVTQLCVTLVAEVISTKKRTLSVLYMHGHTMPTRFKRSDSAIKLLSGGTSLVV